ncbi:MAG: hypothetical protein EOO20_23580 [Chryseobacterium sp.]|nr:MAG: hypothetical protein EOO20_23580 [Chryseobacterium sp.]
MIFYQLRKDRDQKHPYPPPKIISKNISQRYLNRIFRLRGLLFCLILLLSTTSLFAQKITISAKSTKLRQVLNQIERQSGYDFWYTEGTINDSESVNIDVKSQSLNDVKQIRERH